ncbi:MAG: transglutaminase family protein [Muribaculaceae bacterium]|nr:transglutaminase family protein [Muribaculaceae bacterium]
MSLYLHHHTISICFTFLCCLCTWVCARADDNVIAVEEKVTYTLQSEKETLTGVKKVSEITYTSLRTDDKIIATEMFGEHVSIDKASAPGAKPYYRSWESGDLFHTGSRICIMDVPLPKGKHVKVNFASTVKWPQQFCKVYLCSPYFTQSSTVSIIIPSNLASRYAIKPYRLPDTMKLERHVEKNGDIIYSVTTTNRHPIRYESGAPSLSIDCPQLIITGHFADVDDLYSYMSSFTKDNAPTDDKNVVELSRRLTSGCPTPLAMIDSVAAWVRQNIRYVAIENGEYALRPASPSEVLVRRYGDCKGSANLIKALLRNAGLDTRLVWVGTNDEVSTGWEDNPSLMSGNHQIACVVLPDTIVYIDGTVTWAPDGYIPTAIRDTKVLVEDGETCMIKRMPGASRESDEERLHARFAVKGNDLIGVLSRTYTGAERAGVVAAWAALDVADKATFLERLLTYPKKNQSAANPRLELENASAPECRIVSEAVIDKQGARSIGDKLYVALLPFRMIGFETVAMRERTRGLAPRSAAYYRAEISLELPEGYEVEQLPDRATINSEWFSGEVAYDLRESEIVCTASLKSGHDGVAFDNLEAYNEVIKRINRISNNQIILRRHEN